MLKKTYANIMKQNHLNKQFVLQHFNQTPIIINTATTPHQAILWVHLTVPTPSSLIKTTQISMGYPQMMSSYYSTKYMVIVFILNVIKQNIITTRSQLKSLTTSSCSIWGISPNSGCIKYFLVGEPTNTP